MAPLIVRGCTLIALRVISDGQDFVLRAAPILTLATLFTQIDVVELNSPTQQMVLFARSPRPRQLMGNQSSLGIPLAELARERPCKKYGLGLTHQLQGHEPDHQCKFGALKHRTGRQRSLVSARIELEEMEYYRQLAMFDPMTECSWKAARPPCRLKGRCALGIVAKALQNVRQ